jgi:hypothetical protein
MRARDEDHICRGCLWAGAENEVLPMGRAERLAVLEGLEPGEPVPSGRCPRCGDLAHPETIFSAPLPVGVDADDPSARWIVSIKRLSNALAVYLSNPSRAANAEILLDAIGDRPRLEITSFARAADLDQEPQTIITLGDGNVAAMSPALAITSPVVFGESGPVVAEPMTPKEFVSLSGWTEFAENA